MTQHAIAWFEIPVRDIARAQAFYEGVLATELRRETMGAEQLAVFPASADGGVSGCLLLPSNPVAPSTEGTRVYLDAGPSIDATLARVPAAGGRITTPKTALPPGMGYYACFADSEGNVVGLFSMA